MRKIFHAVYLSTALLSSVTWAQENKESKQAPEAHLKITKDFEQKLSRLTLECRLRPLELKLRQGIISQGSGRSFALILKDGKIHFKTAGKTLSIEEGKIAKAEWVHIAACWDGTRKSIWINGQKHAEGEFSGTFSSTEKLRIGALNRKGEAGLSLDGDLAQCVIYNRVLTAEEIKERSDKWELKLPLSDDIVAYWPLNEGEGTIINDKGPHAYHGILINMNSWIDAVPDNKESAGRKALRFKRQRFSKK